MRLEGGHPKSKWGYINQKGEPIVPPIYEYARDFSNGRGLLNVGGKWQGMSGISFQAGMWGVVDTTGKFVVDPKIAIDEKLPLAEWKTQQDSDFAPVNYGGRHGFRDQHWNFVVEPQFEAVLPFSEGLAAVKRAGKFGYINSTGEWKIEPRFSTAGQFSEGLAPVKTGSQLIYIDQNGKIVLEINGDEARPFHGGIAAVRKGQLWGIIDKHGRYIHRPQFAQVLSHGDDFYLIEKQGGLRGLMDLKGKVVVPPKYDAIGGFQENGFAMLISESWGLPREFWLTDKQGRLIPGPMIPFEAADAGKTIVFFPKQSNEKWGIVDDKGNVVVEPKYDEVELLAAGILGVRERL